MKKIITDSFKKMADMVTHPPVDGEGDGSKMPYRKGWKYMPQLGKWVRDIEVEV